MQMCQRVSKAREILCRLLAIMRLSALMFVLTAGILITGCKSQEDLQADICEAASNGDADKVKQLIGKGADVNATSKNQRTPLHSAAEYGYIDVAEILIAHGADINAKTGGTGRTALHLAAYAGKQKFLISKGAEVNAKNIFAWTPLYDAVAGIKITSAKVLIAGGAEVNAKDDQGLTPLHVAATAGDVTIIELLTAKGAIVDSRDLIGQTPLHKAAWEGNKRAVENLIKCGADVNARGEQGLTPLDLANEPSLDSANEQEKKEVVKILCLHGAKGGK